MAERKKTKKRARNRISGPGSRYLLLGAVVFLVLAGVVMVFSAAFAEDFGNTGDTAHSLKRQLVYVALGTGLLLIFSRVDYRRLRDLAWTALLVTDMGLVAVLFMGVEQGGARRWLDMGPFTIQPSELAKLACVLALAAVMTDKSAKDENTRLWRIVPVVPPVIALVMLEPDMGTAMAILIASFTVLWLGGLSWSRTFSLAGIAAAFTGLAIAVAPYRLERYLSFRDPWADPLGSGYQTIQAILAFGSGGLTGVGLGMSMQKFNYLPEAHTDFILAVIGEELGLIGTLAVVAAFVTLTIAGFRIAVGSKDPFGRLLAGGLTAMIVTQAALNMLAVTNLMPVTGIPLPFVSFGGNSMLVTMIAVGMIISVSRFGNRRSVRKKVAVSTEGGDHARTPDRRRDRRTRLPGARGGGRARLRRA